MLGPPLLDHANGAAATEKTGPAPDHQGNSQRKNLLSNRVLHPDQVCVHGHGRRANLLRGDSPPTPAFRMAIGKRKRGPVAMPRGRRIVPLGHGRSEHDQKKAIINGVQAFVHKNHGVGRIRVLDL